MNRILLLILLALAGGLGYAYWTFNKPHEDVAKMRPDHLVTSADLISQFVDDTPGAEATYAGTVLQVEGIPTGITEIDGQSLITFDSHEDFIILAYLSANGAGVPQMGKELKLKCKYSGYIINDEDFLIPADIKIEQCYVQL